MSYERDPVVETLPYFRSSIPDALIRQVLQNEGDFLLRWRSQKGSKGQYYVTVLFCDRHDDNYIVKDDPLYMFRHRKRSALSVQELIELYVRDRLPVTIAFGPVLVRPRERQVWEIELGGKVEMKPITILGTAPHGDIYRAHWLKTDNTITTVAVKTFNKVLGKKDEQSAIKDRIEKLDILRRIGAHNSILSPHAYGIAVDQERPMVIYELIPGNVPLHLLLTHRRLPVDVKLKLILEALEGIAHIHRKGWLHRDICAANCLVDCSAWHLKLVKLGLAQVQGTAKPWSSPPGKLQTAALESLESNVWTVESDMWSVGVFIWEVFSNGSIPYLTQLPLASLVSKEELLKGLKSGIRLEVPATVPPLLANMLKNCWKTPPERPKLKQIVDEIQLFLSKL